MKMKENKASKFLKIGILFIGITLILFNCSQKNDDYLSFENQNTKFIEKIAFNELPENLGYHFSNSKNKIQMAKSHTNEVIILDESQILKLVDDFKNTKFAIKFYLSNQPDNVLYNIILGTNETNSELQPKVVKYTIYNKEEATENGKINFSKIKSKFSIYPLGYFLNFYSKGKSSKTYSKLEEPIPCKEYTNSPSGSDPNNSGGTGDASGDTPTYQGPALGAPIILPPFLQQKATFIECNVLTFSNGSTGEIVGIKWSCSDGTSGIQEYEDGQPVYQKGDETPSCDSIGSAPINEGDDDGNDPSCKSFNFKKLGNYNYSYVKGIRFLIIDKNGHKEYVKYENPIEFGAPYKDRFNNIYENGPLSESSALALSEAIIKTKQFLKKNVFTSQGDIERYFEETLISVYPDYIPGARVKIRPNEILFPPTDYKAAGFSINGISFGLDNCD